MKSRERPRPARLAVLASIALVSAVVALPGCGSGGTEDQPAAAAVPQRALVRAGREMEAADPPLSKARFVARVNRLCRQAWPAIRRNFAVYRSTEDTELSERRRFKQAIGRSLLPEIESRFFTPILSLGAPRGDEAELREIMRWLGEAIELGQGGPGAFPITTPVILWDLFDMFNPLARRYGLGQCLVNARHTGFET
jgi:hypothetical protein